MAKIRFTVYNQGCKSAQFKPYPATGSDSKPIALLLKFQFNVNLSKYPTFCPVVMETPLELKRIKIQIRLGDSDKSRTASDLDPQPCPQYLHPMQLVI
jgi:hypothetical protein